MNYNKCSAANEVYSESAYYLPCCYVCSMSHDFNLGDLANIQLIFTFINQFLSHLNNSAEIYGKIMYKIPLFLAPVYL